MKPLEALLASFNGVIDCDHDAIALWVREHECELRAVLWNAAMESSALAGIARQENDKVATREDVKNVYAEGLQLGQRLAAGGAGGPDYSPALVAVVKRAADYECTCRDNSCRPCLACEATNALRAGIARQPLELEQLKPYLQHKPECELARGAAYKDGEPRQIMAPNVRWNHVAMKRNHWRDATCTCGLVTLRALVREK